MGMVPVGRRIGENSGARRVTGIRVSPNSLPPQHFGGHTAIVEHTETGRAVAGGVVTGFVLFLFSDVVRAFGISETIPVPLAAWAPAAELN